MLNTVALLFALVLCFAEIACGPGTSENTDRAGDSPASTGPSGPTVSCPVCGLTFSQSEAVGSVTVNGNKYYFYLEDHLKAFKADPSSYLAK